MKRHFGIDHKVLFIIGFILYLLSPLLVGYTDLFDGYPGIELYKGFFNQIPDDKIKTYLIVAIAWIPAFLGGHILFSFIKPGKVTVKQFPPDFYSSTTSFISILLFAVLVIFIALGRNSLFGGYASYDVGVRGKFSTLLSLYNFFLIYQMLTEQKLSKLLITGCFITAFLLLTMGGRLYVMQTVLALLVYKTSFSKKRWNYIQIIPVTIISIVVATVLGVWRQGASLSFPKIAYSFFAEPAFTWFSTSTFLLDNDIPVINFPKNFLSSFINMLPNSFFNLRNYVVSVQDMGYVTQSPLGADSLWSNLVINFGTAGSVVFLFITGFLFNFLKRIAATSRFAAAYYIMVCSMLPFQIFRDGFFILNKQLFFNFLLLPAVILMVLKILNNAGITYPKKTVLPFSN